MKEEVFNPLVGLKETARIFVDYVVPDKVAEALGTVKQGALRKIVKACNKRILKDIQEAVKEFNTIMSEALESNPVQPMGKWPYDLAVHIVDQTYARIVAPVAHLLSKSRGFSNLVYGEVKYGFVRELLKVAPVPENGLFLDMVTAKNSNWVLGKWNRECCIPNYCAMSL
jgi:hypothetical protein